MKGEIGGLPWLLFRDVFWVDGRDIRDREDRLERLFLDRSPEGQQKARAVIDEGARFNIGPGRRNYNVPTLVLAFLHPDVQHRFRFERTGAARIDGRRFAELRFEEVSHPTAIRNSRLGLDLPASGLVWISPDDGTVGRTRLVLEPGRDEPQFVAELETLHQPQPSLGLWLPVEMKDAWETAPRGHRLPGTSCQSLEGRATYSNFRKARGEVQGIFRPP